jgi:hypothetical protein
MLRAFGYYDGAISIFPDTGFYFPQKFLFVERDLGEEDDVWRIAFLFLLEGRRRLLVGF